MMLDLEVTDLRQSLNSNTANIKDLQSQDLT